MLSSVAPLLTEFGLIKLMDARKVFEPAIGSARGAPGLAAEEHRAVHAALVAGDPDAAAARMREHIENAKARVLNDRKAIMDE